MKKSLNKNSKYILALCVAFINIATISHANAEPIIIRLSHVVAIDTPKGQMGVKFKELVADRLGNDKVLVELYPNSTLVPDSQIGEALLDGRVQLGAPSFNRMIKYSKRLQLFDIPFLFVSPEAAQNFLKNEYGERILRLIERKGFKGLGYLDNGMKQLSANVPIRKPEDIAKLRFRIMNSNVLEAQFKQVDAVPIKTPFSKVYKLLESGQIDGQENTWSNIYSKKFYEHQPYIIESNHGYLGYMIISSKKFWDSLPLDVKSVVEKSLQEAIEYGNQIALDKVKSDKEKIIATNTSDIHTLTVDERIRWVTAMQPVWRAYENEVGTDLIQAAASSR